MRVVQNTRRIRIGSAIGRTVPWIALAVLFAGLVISFVRPQWVWAMLVSVTVGLILSIFGGYFAEHYVGPLAHHAALARALKGLDDRYILVEYILPAPHVLVDPGGCTVLVVKSQPGEIRYANGRWYHRYRGKFFRQLAGQEGLGIPHLEAERQLGRLKRWFERRLPGFEIPLRAAIVFIHPRVSLDAETSPVPVFYGKKVRQWVRGPGARKPLPQEEYRRLVEVIEKQA